MPHIDPPKLAAHIVSVEVLTRAAQRLDDRLEEFESYPVEEETHQLFLALQLVRETLHALCSHRETPPTTSIPWTPFQGTLSLEKAK